jgi:SecD/SecF fusion protein
MVADRLLDGMASAGRLAVGTSWGVLGQVEEAVAASGWWGGLDESTKTFLVSFLVLLAVIACYFVGGRLARFLRMPTDSFRFGTVLTVVLLGLLVVTLGKFKFGPDIRGGTILVYELDRESLRTTDGQERPFSAEDLVGPLNERLNPSGTKDIVIRPYGDDQIEIIVPDVDRFEIDEIKRVIQSAGVLRFRIVANGRDHADIIRQAREQAESTDASVRMRRDVFAPDGQRVVGQWYTIGREAPNPDGLRRLREWGPADTFRDARTGRIIELPRLDADRELAFERWLEQQGIAELDMLIALEKAGLVFEEVNGDDLDVPSKTFDQRGGPAVSFTMTLAGSQKLAALTGINQPDQGFRRRMAIILDGRVLSAPNLNSTIRDQGQITGNFTSEEVDFLVRILRSGSLPATLGKEPVAENQIGAVLGATAISKGFWAAGVSMVLTLLFLLVYYRFAGLVACIALAINFLIIFAMMILIQQPITLPGLAGLVLTVGMSVDANVLIFERIREELSRGSTGRMAIRNGFDRAMSTIIDANLTTMLSAIVLYWRGTDQIRGFAVTLIIGIVASMFTAIYCSRLMFDLAERRQKARFSMMDLAGWLRRSVLGQADVDFMSKRSICFILSAVLVLGSLVLTAVRGRGILDIDFVGGTSVVFSLEQPTEAQRVRDLATRVLDVDGDGNPISSTLVEWVLDDASKDRVYRLDTSLQDVNELTQRLTRGFRDEAGVDLVTYRVSVSPAAAASATGSWLPAAGAARLVAWQPPEGGADASGEASGEAADEAASPPQVSSRYALTFNSGQGGEPAKINARSLLEKLMEAGSAAGVTLSDAQIDVEPVIEDLEGWSRDSVMGYEQWEVRLPIQSEAADRLMSELESRLAGEPVWLQVSNIKGKVAGDMQLRAISALLLSLLFIVIYIWFRFQKVAYGLAAVIALAHDVLITLGAIAISHWLYAPLGFLLIEDFKIGLTTVAAFLTIIGYSLNDTIVVFDRIREVKGKSPHLTADVINRSINQTLSRTLLTSATTLLVVGLLYVFGGEGLHGFAFTLLIGILVGTYSSIFVAAPVLLWLSGSKARPVAVVKAKV